MTLFVQTNPSDTIEISINYANIQPPGRADYFLLNALFYSKLRIEDGKMESAEKRPRIDIGRVVGRYCYITGHS